MEPVNEVRDNEVRENPIVRQFIKFTHEEVEALLNLLNESSPLSEIENSARDKLKKIYARQILSHEKWS